MKSQQVAEWLMKRGVGFSVREDADGVMRLAPSNGFYKSDGLAWLADEGEKCVLHARYNERTEVHSPWDVVASSKDWHEFSEDRFAGWESPAEPWGQLYTELMDRLKAGEVAA